MPLFDAYSPTRTANSLEVRVRSALDGPVAITCGDAAVILEHPDIAYNGLHFFRHTFLGLPAAAAMPVEVRGRDAAAGVAFDVTTLPAPPGPPKLRIGVLADLHLQGGARADIRRYRHGIKRLTGLGVELAEKYIRRLEALGADLIVLPGDLVDPCTAETLGTLKTILASVDIPCYPIIGNHEPWSQNGARRFYEALDLPDGGFYAVRQNGVILLMLSTPDPAALAPGSAQYLWLQQQLDETASTDDIVLCSHFSLCLHPCVSGPRNDGYQLLDAHRALRRLLGRYDNVRLFVAGHKNVPSVLTADRVIHTLSPQLIQAPCGYDMLSLFDGGVARTTYEIEEQHYAEVARAAYAYDFASRYGDEAGRNFYLPYPV